MNTHTEIERQLLAFVEHRLAKADETRRAIARRAGITTQHLRHLRSGGHGKRGPTLLTVERLAAAFGFRAVLTFEPLVQPAEQEVAAPCEP